MIDNWIRECHDHTSHSGDQLFGEFIQIGCPIDDAETVLVYREDVNHDCKETIKIYKDALNSNDTNQEVRCSSIMFSHLDMIEKENGALSFVERILRSYSDMQ